MKPFLLKLSLIVCLVAVAACQPLNKTSDAANPSSSLAEGVSNNPTSNPSPTSSPTPTPTPEPTLEPIVSLKPLSPIYLEEADYTDDELAIVQVINDRVEYIWEENEEEYLKLLYESSSYNGLPVYKIEKIELRSDISIQEQKYVYQAVVSVIELIDDGQEVNPLYVLLKKKEKGAVWKIADID